MHPVERFAEYFAAALRHEQHLYERRGLAEASRMLESVLQELVASAADWLDEPLNLRDAAEMAGYSYSTLEHLVRQGRLENAGEKGRPRVRRRDLPQRSMTGVLGRTPGLDGDDDLDVESLVDALL